MLTFLYIVISWFIVNISGGGDYEPFDPELEKRQKIEREQKARAEKERKEKENQPPILH